MNKIEYNHAAEESSSEIYHRGKERNYWLNKLSGDYIKSSFPFDHRSDKKDKPAMMSYAFVFPEEIISRLIRLSNSSDIRLYIILMTGVVLLLEKYTYGGNRDIIIGAPIYRQDIQGDFINRIVVLRNPLHDHMAFKELLLQVSQTNWEALEHINYPIETMPFELNMPYPENEFPLFDVAVLLENIHDQSYIAHLDLEVIFSFSRKDNSIEGIIEYNSLLYRQETIKRIVSHYIKLMHRALANIDLKIADISVISDEETRKLVEDFNSTQAEYPREKTIHELFRERVNQAPQNIAIQYETNRLTFKELDEASDRLAYLLRNQGVEIETIVAILLENSIELVTAILAVLKAGGAYLPIDSDYPGERIDFMLKDSGAKLLVTTHNTGGGTVERWEGKKNFGIIFLDSLFSHSVPTSYLINFPNSHPFNLAYIIYTSGSTGRPKGVMIRHFSVVNYVWWAAQTYLKDEKMNFPFYSSISFDLTVTSLFTPLITGNTIIIYWSKDKNLLVEKIIEQNKVGVIKLTPSHLYMIKYKHIEHSNIRCIIVGGEILAVGIAREIFEKFKENVEIYNEYGPTEATVGCLMYRFSPIKDTGHSVPIGVPINETRVYILDRNQKPVPVGVSGEIYVLGDGVAVGYLNSPELTAEKFISNVFSEGKKMYRTGDLARMLPEGNIDFLGRIDQQIKIRGYRIELAEIERVLSQHMDVKESVVIARDSKEKSGYDEKQDQYLCAYFTASREFQISELRDYLSKHLPDYMVPLYFIQLEEIPLTPNGKVNKETLPLPEIKKEIGYTAPRDEIEKKLVNIWSEVLRIDNKNISIDANFFELGGHSLKQVFLISQVHKEFNVKVPLAELFNSQTVRKLSRYIKEAVEDKYIPIEPAEKKEYYELSSTQKRIYFLQQMDLENTAYNVPHLVTLVMQVDLEKVKKVFQHMASRHESLRTSFIIVEDRPVQKINMAPDITTEYYDLESKYNLDKTLGDDSVKEILKRFIRPFDLSKAPLFRVGLIRLEEKKFMLMVDVHHIIGDGVSTVLMTRQFTEVYRGKTIPELRLQYRDYAEWQNSKAVKERIIVQEEYWIKEFESEIPILNLPTDYLRPLVQSFKGRAIEFKIGMEETTALNALAMGEGTTLYMVMITVFSILLSKLSNQEDILIGTPVVARRHADLDEIIGVFVNTLVLRSYPKSGKRYSDLLQEIKLNALDAFENQEYQFEDLVERISLVRDTSRNPLFDAMFGWFSYIRDPNSDSTLILDTVVNPVEFAIQTSKFDITFNSAENEDGISLYVEYSSILFKEKTILRFIEHFKRILTAIIEAPHLQISQIEIISKEEKETLMYGFNNTMTEYPVHKTIHQLFAEQVERTHDNVAVIGSIIRLNSESLKCQLTYGELNEKSNRLAGVLIDKGVQPDAIVGIMMERSLEMITGIWGILKSGGAYLPIDPEYPQERIAYMLKDSGAKLLITANDKESRKVRSWEGEKIILESILDSLNDLFYHHPTYDIPSIQHSHHLCYIIYTSGSSGKPKGVLTTHFNVVRIVRDTNYLSFKEEDRILQLSNYAFDGSVFDIYGALLNGAALVMVSREILLEADRLGDFIKREAITVFFVTTALFNTLVDIRLDCFENTRKVLFGGERVSVEHCREALSYLGSGRIIHVYGPTETTVYASYYFIDHIGERVATIPIGAPLANTAIYILDKYRDIVPIGVNGEIYIGGKGTARGYLNSPELTAERFLSNNKFYGSDRNYILYKTGDLARWLLDGNIEFLGRVDQQVKIRGFRIELGEIEMRLLNYPGIKEVVVLAQEESGDKYICAYIVSDKEYGISELRESLSKELPDYMIPSYFVQLEKIPLTPNGKVDRRVLPKPEMNEEQHYVAPRNETEVKLVGLWAIILNIKSEVISIDSNFFQLGGHSLKATILASRIHKELNLKLPLAEIFKNPTIRGLSEYIMGTVKNIYESIMPAEEKQYYGLSSAQKRLYFLQQLNLASAAYHIPMFIPLLQDVHMDKLEQAFKRLIKRHESLRTSFHMIDNEPVQKIHADVEFAVKKIDFTTNPQAAVESLFHPFDLSKAPLIRVGFFKTREGNSHLLVTLHHIITDGTSQEVLKQDFMTFYKGEELPPLRLQYKDFAEWQNNNKEREELKQQELYWVKEFAGEIPVLNIPTDYPRPIIQSYEGNRLDFEISPEETEVLKAVALQDGATLFMILVAAFNILLSRLSGQEEIIIGIPIAGRRHADLEKVIGMFVNTLALKNYPAGEKIFRDFLAEVKEKTLKAFENQDYQYEALVEQVVVDRDARRNPLFDTMFALQNFDSQKKDITDLKLIPYEYKYEYEYENKTAKFDLTLFANENNGGINFSLEYCSKLFKKETIERFTGYFKKIVTSVIKKPDIRIYDIEIIGEEEHNRVLTAISNKEDKTSTIDMKENRQNANLVEGDFDF